MDPLSTSSLFEQFLAERRYLKNVTPSTIEWYETAFKAFRRTVDNPSPNITKTSLQHFVIALRQRGVKPVSCNTYIKAMNAFCRWLHEGGHHCERLELPTLRVEKLVIQTLNDDHIRRLLTVKPKRFDQWRLHGLIALLLDTGIRIEEGLSLRLPGVDFDNLLVTVYGKGRKERRIPFSLELRKVLFRYMQIRGKQPRGCDLLLLSVDDDCAGGFRHWVRRRDLAVPLHLVGPLKAYRQRGGRNSSSRAVSRLFSTVQFRSGPPFQQPAAHQERYNDSRPGDEPLSGRPPRQSTTRRKQSPEPTASTALALSAPPDCRPAHTLSYVALVEYVFVPPAFASEGANVMEFLTGAAILPVKDVAAAVARYVELGFKGRLYEGALPDGRPIYGFLKRGGIDLHLALVSNLDPEANTSAVYLYVDDPDALFSEWTAVGPEGRLDRPEDREWGMREMTYSDPDGNLLRIGRMRRSSTPHE